MRKRTPSEIKAYGDGYANAYKQFCHLLEKNDKDKAICEMEIFAKAVEITVETAMDEPSSSEIPNNCEHITEDGVTCAKYPACDDCLDNPLNKVKGSERLVKGSEKPNNSTSSKMEQVDKDINVRSKWETPPKFEHKGIITTCVGVPMALIEDEPQTDCAWK